ncbi:hypothetical protein K469DRAFT_747049 [Zopfia rhizophila CBS 207.26]|uniref:Uncharacterized protein n=1 Tax=Zopfia rhizophila CBS 207.26 TaxID=1314779 RepID=A0A6A6EEW6_9PEZI|nr:hypothetical protein K469DRAFT_747049 [Zopfia rhizophila CBS 207.26]
MSLQKKKTPPRKEAASNPIAIAPMAADPDTVSSSHLTILTVYLSDAGHLRGGIDGASLSSKTASYHLEDVHGPRESCFRKEGADKANFGTPVLMENNPYTLSVEHDVRRRLEIHIISQLDHAAHYGQTVQKLSRFFLGDTMHGQENETSGSIPAGVSNSCHERDYC